MQSKDSPTKRSDDDIIRSLMSRVNELQTAVDESYAEISKAEKRIEEERRYFTGAVLTACGVTTFDKGDPSLPSEGPPSVGWALQAVRAVVAERDRLREASQRSEAAHANALLADAPYMAPAGVGCWEQESGEEKILADGFDAARRR